MTKNEKISKCIFEDIEKIDTLNFSKKKVVFFEEMITKSSLAIQRYKNMDIITANELNKYTLTLEELYAELKIIGKNLSYKKKKINYNDIINKLQRINNELANIFKSYGTQDIDDLINVALGCNFIDENITTEKEKNKYAILKKYVHPISYKVLPWKKSDDENKVKTLSKNRIVEDFMIVESSQNFDCFDLARTSRKFQKKVYGIKVAIHNLQDKKMLIICGIVDDLVRSCINQPFLVSKIADLIKEKPQDPDFQTADFTRFIDALTVKELLIYRNSELYQRFVGYLNQVQLMKQKPISQNVTEFINSELYGQRRALIQLLIKYNDPEFQYMAYLLYDLLSNESHERTIDTVEQTLLFDSLPWNIKKYFREAMHSTIQYTQNLSNFDNSRIPIEQQICLLKVGDKVKEKAMIKLKEVKAKSEDSGSKARQYLDGILKIPFGIYRSEAILSNMKDVHKIFIEMITFIHNHNCKIPIDLKERYSSLEIAKHSKEIEDTYIPQIIENEHQTLVNNFCKGKRDTLIANICYINAITKKRGFKKKIRHSGRKNNYMKEHITAFINDTSNNIIIKKELRKRFPKYFSVDICAHINKNQKEIKKRWKTVTQSINEIHDRLDNAIHGHNVAKRQIERIIGEWMNGKQTGYCFGFEGPPGVGKTSLAKKGLASCLKNDNGECRPFSFIAVGGSSNGSTLQGHNYTYVGSTWGRIVDILMETKCMNPIIFIDELDKVSRSEHGKEIIGILTHLVDETQNESFQDKYFSGIDLDLSKALFIFSYNDAQMIDKILLDRIHRVKFDNLSLDDKLTITNKYLLPEIYEKISLQDTIRFEDETIKFIIETYTYEAGVRKLKEILTEIIREINLEILSNKRTLSNIPIVVTKDEIANKYLKERHEVIHKKIHATPSVGIMNGLWANALGNGGIIPIEVFWYLAQNPLDFKLTGLQGDVMKESMNVAKTLAWKLAKKSHNKLIKMFEKTKMQGIHIHCPEGAIPKDGPSAGTAITIAIYSLLTKKKIKNDIAITGEINLQGKVSAIGGLDLKILGGVRAGVKEFIYPSENKKDFKKCMQKYGKKPELNNIKFHSVDTISQVLDLVFV